MRYTLLCLALVAPARTMAQPKPVELNRPERALDETFSQIVSVRELKDGRVVVVDLKEKLVQIADFAKQTVQTISRNGSGPGEYNMPAGLVALPGDQLWVYDPMNQRFLALGADGKPGETITFASLGGLKGASMMYLPGADNRGRLYFESITAASLAGKDSTPILRWTRGQPLDTAGFTAPIDLGVESKGGKVRLRALRMFSPQETWVVDPAGRLGRITPAPYRVIWYEGQGKTTLGPVVPYQPVPVTEEEKEEVRKQIRKAIAGAAAGRKIDIPEPEFAETKPPFPAKGAALIGPGGEIWVARSVGPHDRTLYDRFDAKGRLAGQVTLVPRAAIAGFGRGTIYVARRDEDDVVHLERYRWPAR